jgi:hypothetical protein
MIARFSSILDFASSGVVSSELGSQLTGFEPQTSDQIVENPEQFTSEAIRNTSRAGIARHRVNFVRFQELHISRIFVLRPRKPHAQADCQHLDAVDRALRQRKGPNSDRFRHRIGHNSDRF